MGSRRAYDVVSFDVGHTLVHLDTERVARLIDEVHGVRIAPATLGAAEQRARLGLDRADLVAVTNDDERWRAYLEATLRHAGLPATPLTREIADTLERVNEEDRICSRIPPGVPGLLARLHDAGYRLVVVSNAGGEVQSFLESVGLAAHFVAIIDSGAVRVEKPDPRIFELALAPMGVPPRRAVHVGDTYHVDVVGAQRAGLAAVLLDPLGARVHHGCAVIRALEEIASVLDRPSG